MDENEFPCEVILWEWLSLKGADYSAPITFRTLINVIYKLDEYFKNDYNELANKIKFTVEAHHMMDTDYIPSLVRECSKELDKKYQKDSVIDDSHWISKRLDQKITFVDLKLKEGNNDNVTLDDALNDTQDGMRILFTGRPGVGKTTITRYLSKHMHTFKQFSLVIKLHLGALSGSINNLNALLRIHIESFNSNDIEYISNFFKGQMEKVYAFCLMDMMNISHQDMEITSMTLF